jgi:hypothetical protein
VKICLQVRGLWRITGSQEITTPENVSQTDWACIAAGERVVGGPGVKPGFAASDAAVLFGYTTHPFGTRAGNPTRISSLGPKRHHALDHASLTNMEGMQRIEL